MAPTHDDIREVFHNFKKVIMFGHTKSDSQLWTLPILLHRIMNRTDKASQKWPLLEDYPAQAHTVLSTH